MDFGPDDDDRIKQIQTRPLFVKASEATSKTLRITPKTRKREAPDLIKEALGRDLRNNTRAAVDPFLAPQDWSRPRSLKRKSREAPEEPAQGVKAQAVPDTEQAKANSPPPAAVEKPPGLGLEDYDSDD